MKTINSMEERSEQIVRMATQTTRIELELKFNAKLTAEKREQFRITVQDVLAKHGAPPTAISCREGSTELLVMWDAGVILLAGGGLLATSIITGFGNEIGKVLMEWMRKSSKGGEKTAVGNLPESNAVPEPIERLMLEQRSKIIAFSEDFQTQIGPVLPRNAPIDGDIILIQRNVIEDTKLKMEHIHERTMEVQNWQIKKLIDEIRTKI